MPHRATQGSGVSWDSGAAYCPRVWLFNSSENDPCRAERDCVDRYGKWERLNCWIQFAFELRYAPSLRKQQIRDLRVQMAQLSA